MNKIRGKKVSTRVIPINIKTSANIFPFAHMHVEDVCIGSLQMPSCLHSCTFCDRLWSLTIPMVLAVIFCVGLRLRLGASCDHFMCFYVRRAACCMLRAACCMLRAACCVLLTACCILRAACWVACCILRDACCVLHAASWCESSCLMWWLARAYLLQQFAPTFVSEYFKRQLRRGLNQRKLG